MKKPVTNEFATGGFSKILQLDRFDLSDETA